MFKPDVSSHKPSAEYTRALVANSGLSQQACARQIGISVRAMRYYLADGGTPYLVQFALECLQPVIDGVPALPGGVYLLNVGNGFENGVYSLTMPSSAPL